jgi:hypothetical protein
MVIIHNDLFFYRVLVLRVSTVFVELRKIETYEEKNMCLVFIYQSSLFCSLAVVFFF